jgi:hypothetical protein
VSPCLGGFEGFDLTNPRGQLGGERFHLSCSKLGLGDAILSHTILLQIHSVSGGFYISHRYTEREGAPLGVSSKGGTFVELDQFDLAKEKGFWRFQLVGFICRDHSTIFGSLGGILMEV